MQTPHIDPHAHLLRQIDLFVKLMKRNQSVRAVTLAAAASSKRKS